MDIDLDEIENALINGHFFLEYLPIMRLEGNVCVGAEALIRWRRESEVLQPKDFIPEIEDTPFSGLVTYWVMETVAHELGSWLRDTEGVMLTINVPPEILGRGGLMYVASKCGLFDVMNKIVIEVTERGVPDRLGLRALNEGKKRGLRICLDDVRVSDENLFLMIRANVDMLKLDKSFADEMLSSNWPSNSTKALATYIQSTAVKIIAEGVEKKSQRDTFHQVGVDMAQGWYFSRSLCASDFREFFRSHCN